MFRIAFPVMEIIAGLSCILFHKRFAAMANDHHKRLLLRKYDDEGVLSACYIAAGTFLIAVGLWQLI